MGVGGLAQSLRGFSRLKIGFPICRSPGYSRATHGDSDYVEEMP